MHGFSVYVIYNISYLQIVVLGILFSSSKMGRKNLMLMRARHLVKLKSTKYEMVLEVFVMKIFLLEFRNKVLITYLFSQ